MSRYSRVPKSSTATAHDALFFTPPGKSEESTRFRSPMSWEDWQAARHEILGKIEILKHEGVLSWIREIIEGIDSLDGLMSHYCSLTCPHCQDPCCSGHSVFFNQADLIYLAASGQPFPPGQTRSRHAAPCRYLQQYGCSLSRRERPYVCVWFLCDDQMRLFESEAPREQRKIIATFERIRSCRLNLEQIYETQLR